jgi:hypothetical protein
VRVGETDGDIFDVVPIKCRWHFALSFAGR